MVKDGADDTALGSVSGGEEEMERKGEIVRKGNGPYLGLGFRGSTREGRVRRGAFICGRRGRRRRGRGETAKVRSRTETSILGFV